MRIVLSIPASNERGPKFVEQSLASIHQANPSRLPFTLELCGVGGRVTLASGYPAQLRAIIEGQLLAHYPDLRIERMAEPTIPPGHRVWVSELRLMPDLFPLRRFGQFEDALTRTSADPLPALLSTLAPRSRALESRIELLVRPAHARRRRTAERCLTTLSRPFLQRHRRLARLYRDLALSHRVALRLLGRLIGFLVPKGEGSPPSSSLTRSATHTHEREGDLEAAADKLNHHLFEVQLRLIVTGEETMADAARQKLQEIAGSFGLFSTPRLGAFKESARYVTTSLSTRFRSKPFLLATEELATLWHPATALVRAHQMATVESREFEPPVTLPTPQASADLAILGVTAFRHRRHKFGILPDDRMRHIAVLGKTGMGKSTLLYNMILADIRAGHGCCLLDPHGDLCEQLLSAVPSHRTNDVILFDAGDASHPLAFNPLWCPDPAKRPLIASAVLSSFKKLFSDSWGPRLEHIFRNALLALIEVPGSTLLSVLRLLTDRRFRQSVVARVSDPVVREFWRSEFARMHQKLQIEAIAPIQNKVGAFASSPLLRNILGQSESKLDLRDVMDSGRVLLVNLSKGRIGEDSSSLLGSLLISSLQIAAMNRAEVPEWLRRSFFVYVDEFQNFATESFATILSEARKYRLSLTLANQYLTQMDEATAAAVFGNVGSLLAFQVGAQDAEMLAEELGGDMTAQDLLKLPKYQAYARLLIDGMPSRPFSMKTLSPQTRRNDPRRAEIIRRNTRHRYGRPLSDVQARIHARLMV